MTLTGTVLLVALALYAVALVALARLKSSASGSDAIFGHRNYGPVAAAVSLVSGFRDGAGITVWLTLAVAFGFGMLSLWVGVLVGLVGVALIAKRIRESARAHDIHALDELIGHYFGAGSRAVGVAATVIAGFFFTCAQIHVCGEVLAAFTPLAGGVAKALVTAVLAVYLLLGRFVALIRTDILQWSLVLVVLLLILALEGWSNPAALGNPIPAQMGVGLAALSALIIFAGPDTWQRIFAARDTGTTRIGPLAAAGLYLVFALIFLVVAAALGDAGLTLTKEKALFEGLQSANVAVATGAGFAFFILISAMSTADTHIFFVSTSLAKGAAYLGLSSTQTEGRRNLALILAVSVLAFIVSTFIVDLIQFLFDSLSIVSILAPCLAFIAVRGDACRHMPYTGVVMAVSLLAYIAVFFGSDQLLMNLVPAAVALAGLLLVSFLPQTAVRPSDT